MKFISTVSLLFSSVVMLVSAQVTAPTRNYNVTSPVSNGPYVVGQILPCTYRLFSDIDSSALSLEIDLEAKPVGPNSTTITITSSADVSKTDAFIKKDGNLTYYEHSVNFNIPSTLQPGTYQVVFFDKSTNTQLPIPIEIRPAAASTTLQSSVTGTPHVSGSIFHQNGSSTLSITTKTWLALIGIASIAFLL